MRERRGFRNRALLDFVCAVAAVQEAPEIPLGRAAGLDPYGLDMAVGMALRHGFIHPVAPGRYIVTLQGLGWASAQLAQARALLALETRALRPAVPDMKRRQSFDRRLLETPPLHPREGERLLHSPACP